MNCYKSCAQNYPSTSVRNNSTRNESTFEITKILYSEVETRSKQYVMNVCNLKNAQRKFRFQTTLSLCTLFFFFNFTQLERPTLYKKMLEHRFIKLHLHWMCSLLFSVYYVTTLCRC